MKLNKVTSALIALGVLSLASVAQANQVVYITGSTAARLFFYDAATTPGDIFPAGGTVVSPASTANNGANIVTFEGTLNIGGVPTVVDLNCSWTGSEAGIAAIANQTLTQSIDNPTLGYSNPAAVLPGVPKPSFYTPESGFTAKLPIDQIPSRASQIYPDLSMADNSQAVSLTPKSLYNLTDYGIVGIIPFTWMKGYQATPDAAWNNTLNLTTAQANQLLGSPLPANFVTGVAADAADGAYVCGRNRGSGTRVNTLMNMQYGVTTPVDQYAYNVYYTAAGVLSQTTTSYIPDANGLVEVSNDGFDSGGNVVKEGCIDGTGTGNILLCYAGVSDAVSVTPTQISSSITSVGGGSPTMLPFNGNYESDAAIINGSYSFWGQEHVMGNIGQSPTSVPGQVAASIKTGLHNRLATMGAGTGNIVTNPTGQSGMLPTALMQVKRSLDYGFPSVATYGY